MIWRKKISTHGCQPVTNFLQLLNLQKHYHKIYHKISREKQNNEDIQEDKEDDNYLQMRNALNILK